MKFVDLLRIERESLKLVSESGLKASDYKYVEMYDEYASRRRKNEKYRYVIMLLAEKYKTSESNVKRILKRLGGEFNP